LSFYTHEKKLDNDFYNSNKATALCPRRFLDELAPVVGNSWFGLSSEVLRMPKSFPSPQSFIQPVLTVMQNSF